MPGPMLWHLVPWILLIAWWAYVLGITTHGSCSAWPEVYRKDQCVFLRTPNYLNQRLIHTEFNTSALLLNQIHGIILLIFSAPCEALCEWHPLLEQSTKNMSISKAIVFEVAPTFHHRTTPKLNNFPIPIKKNIHYSITSETTRYT